MLANLVYNKIKKRGSRERSPPPCQIRTLILPRCPEACGNIFNLDLTLTRKFFELSGHAGASLTGHVCAPSNGFRAAVYDSIGPPLTFMIINSGTRWLPEPETFGSKSGRVCRPKAQTGHQPHSFGRALNVERALRKSRVIGRLKLLMNFDGPNEGGPSGGGLVARAIWHQGNLGSFAGIREEN